MERREAHCRSVPGVISLAMQPTYGLEAGGRCLWREVGDGRWEMVSRGALWVVAYVLFRRKLDGISALSGDELRRRRGKKSDNHVTPTIAYEIEAGCRCLLRVGLERKGERF